MTLETTAIFLFAYFMVCVSFFLASLLNADTRKIGLGLLLLSVISLISTVALSSITLGGGNFVSRLLNHLINFDRDELAAFMLGCAAAMPTCLILIGFSKTNKVSRGLVLTFAGGGVVCTAFFGLLIVAKELISPYLPIPSSTLQSAIGRLAPDGFVIEDYANTELIPVRLAVSPDDRVFVSGHIGIAAQSGAVVELVQQENGVVDEILVADKLNRPYGLVVTEDHIFVSRSGQYTKWTDGRVENISTGAVTRLTDLDNDGIMDHYHDVVSGLPGAKGPDYLHQNNGIAIDSTGALFITTANETDGHPSKDDLAGAILKASGVMFEDVEVYASGLRNPFGLAFGPDGKLYATDNDTQTGLLGNLGDKLLSVNEGDFYGHPYALDSDPSVTKPLMRSSFSLGGLALANAKNLPSEYNNKLYVVVYGEGRIMQIDVNDNNDVQLLPFATVPGAVDIAISSDGNFYVGVYPDKVVRIRYEGAES